MSDPRVFPTELCGIQVIVNDTPAGLLWVGPRQINLKFPVNTPNGTALVHVVRDGVSSDEVTVKVGPPYIQLSLAEPAYVGMPVWLKAFTRGQPVFYYPVYLPPPDTGCNDIEVRFNGQLLPRIPETTQMREGIYAGPACGFLGLERERVRPGQFPLQLLYRFDKPGTYEVRVISRWAGMGGTPGRVRADSAWTPIEIRPAEEGQRARWLADMSARLPTDTVDVLSDFLPTVLGVPDAPSLEIVVPYLHHPEERVRRYTMHALSYWPRAEADAAIQSALEKSGPSDVIADRIAGEPNLSRQRADSFIESAIASLKSDAPVRLRGSLVAIKNFALRDRAPASAPLREQAAAALLEAAEHFVSTADPQTVVDYAGAIGLIKDSRAQEMLWDFVHRHIAVGQSLAAITWQRNPADLTRLGALLADPPDGISEEDLRVLPNTLRANYGAQATPYLEAALQRSAFEGVKSDCARELILLGRPAGFSFARSAIQQHNRYGSSLLQFLKGQFRELREADEEAILEFLQKRSQ